MQTPLAQWRRFDTQWRTWPVKKKALYGAIYFIAVSALTLSVLVVGSGKAHAQCTVGGDTCPAPATFAAKFASGAITHEHGAPVAKFLATPGADHDAFVSKYVTYWNNHPGKRAGMHDHAASLNHKRAMQRAMFRWNAQYPKHTSGATVRVLRKGRVVTTRAASCMEPMSPQCAAGLEWTNWVNNESCGLWRGLEDISKATTCIMQSQKSVCSTSTGNCAKPLTQSEFLEGLKLSTCAASVGLGVVGIITTGPGAIPAAAITTGAISCTMDAWEAFE